MSSRILAIGTLTIVSALATATVVSTFRHTHVRPSVTPGAAPGSARLQVFGSRSVSQQHSSAGAKFDGALADLSRHAARIRPDHAIEDSRSLSPAAKFRQTAPGAATAGSSLRGLSLPRSMGNVSGAMVVSVASRR